MEFQQTPYTAALVLAALLTIVLFIRIWKRRPAPGATYLALAMLGVSGWSLLYGLELSIVDLDAKLTVIRVEYICIASVPTLWLLFVLSYCGFGNWASPRNLTLLSAEPVTIVLLAATTSLHNLFYQSTDIVDTGEFIAFHPTYGPAFWLHVVYSYLILLSATMLLVQRLVRPSKLYRRQAYALLVGVVAPWLGNALYIIGIPPFTNLDPTSLCFTVLGVAMWYGMYRYHFMDLVPVAREAIIENMRDAIIVLDSRERIVDLNPAGIRIMGLQASEIIGKTPAEIRATNPGLAKCCSDLRDGNMEVELVIDKKARFFDRHVSSIGGTDEKPAGKLVVLRDITMRKKAEEVLRRAYEERGTSLEEKDESLLKASMSLLGEIEDRERVQKDLVDSERKFVDFMESLPLGVIVVDHTGKPLYLNRALQHLTGKSLDSLPDGTDAKGLTEVFGLYQTGTDHFYPEERRPLIRAMGGEGSTATDIEIRRADRTIPLEVTATPIFDEKGEVRYALAVLRDISDRKKAEEKERRFLSELKFLSESAMGYIELPPEEDVFEYIAEKCQVLVPDGYVLVSSVDMARKELVVRAVLMPKEAKEEALRIFGGEIAGMVFAIEDWSLQSMQTGKLKEVPGKLHAVTSGKISESEAKRAEATLNLGTIYSMGMVVKGDIFGNIVIMLKKGKHLENGDVIETFIRQASVALQKRLADDRVRNSLKEKEVLLREIHHRVKNNLQLISSLLSLQSRTVKDVQARSVFKESQARVRTLSLVHERLYSTSDLSRVELDDYLRKLTADIFRAYSVSPDSIQVNVEAKGVKLGPDTAIPAGLLVTELVSNCLKHAFPDGRKGTISITVKPEENERFVMVISDDGIGLPEKVDAENTETLGLQLVTSLVEQLNGDMKLDRKGGTKYTIHFSELKYKDRSS